MHDSINFMRCTRGDVHVVEVVCSISSFANSKCRVACGAAARGSVFDALARGGEKIESHVLPLTCVLHGVCPIWEVVRSIWRKSRRLGECSFEEA